MSGIQPIYFILCDDVRLEIGGKVSIIGEYSQIDVPSMPFGTLLCVLTKWSGSPGASAKVSLQMISPESDHPIPIGEQTIEFNSDAFEFAHAGTVNKFPWQFHSAGVHYIRILLDDEEQGHISLLIRAPEESAVSNENSSPLN